MIVCKIKQNSMGLHLLESLLKNRRWIANQNILRSDQLSQKMQNAFLSD